MSSAQQTKRFKNTLANQKMAQQQKHWQRAMGSDTCEFEILLNITLEYEVNKTQEKANLTPLVLSVVEE